MNEASHPTKRRHLGQQGFTLLEVMIAALILIIVMYGVAQFYTRGRRQIDYEEERRKATAAAQFRLDELKTFSYQLLPSYDGTDTTMVVDGRTYTVGLDVTPEDPNDHATTVVAEVEWDLGLTGDTRTLEVTTIIGRIVGVIQ